MRLTTAMLADSAQVQGGKLYVLGGGFGTIRARSLPVFHRNINLALVVEVDAGERHRDLELVVELVDEDGQAIGGAATGRLRVGAQPTPSGDSSSLVPLVVPFHNVRFPEAKGYTFVVRHGDDELGRIRMRVVEAS